MPNPARSANLIGHLFNFSSLALILNVQMGFFSFLFFSFPPCKWHTLYNNSGLDVTSSHPLQVRTSVSSLPLWKLSNPWNVYVWDSLNNITRSHQFMYTHTQNWMAMHCYIFRFLMDQQLVRDHCTVNVTLGASHAACHGTTLMLHIFISISVLSFPHAVHTG